MNVSSFFLWAPQCLLPTSLQTSKYTCQGQVKLNSFSARIPNQRDMTHRSTYEEKLVRHRIDRLASEIDRLESQITLRNFPFLKEKL